MEPKPLHAKVNVHDGVALRSVEITSTEGYYEVLSKVAGVMQRPNAAVLLGYEGPWSAKIGTKKCHIYVSNETELREFWLSLGRYVEKTGKKKGVDTASVEGIMFMDMNNALVSNHYNSLHCLTALPQNVAKPTGRSKETAKAPVVSAGELAKQTARDKILDAEKKVNKGMWCSLHDRTCYIMYNGKHGVYTMENAKEHAKLLVSANVVLHPSIHPNRVSRL